MGPRPSVLLVGGDNLLVSSLVSAGCRLVVAGHGGPDVYSDDRITVVEYDLHSDESKVIEVVENAWNAHGGLDVLLICTSDQGTPKPVLELRESEWDLSVSIHLKAAWLLSKSVVNRMRGAGRGGSIVFITSIAGAERGLFPGTVAQATCSAAIHHLAKIMALEVGKYGIRVNSVARGFSTSDPVLKKLETPERYTKLLPLQRWSQGSQDLVPLVLFLIGEGSSFITGTTMLLDGGQSIVRPRLRGKL